MESVNRLGQWLLDRVARIGADPADTDDVRLRKVLLVLVCLLILPISAVWGAIYLALGAWAGLVAWIYLGISLGAIAIFSRSRDVDSWARSRGRPRPSRRGSHR
jgi:uncharacterized membrane protein YphA (DoxX/SURF4 family)